LKEHKANAFKAIVGALPSDYAWHITRGYDLNWKYGSEIAEAAVECYPRDKIALPEHIDKYHKVADRDEILFVQAARFGNVELLKYILEKYPSSEQRLSLLTRDSDGAFGNITNASETLTVLLDAIPEEQRAKIAEYIYPLINKALEREDRKLFDTVLAALPPLEQCAPSIRARAVVGKLIFDIDSMSVPEIAALFTSEMEGGTAAIQQGFVKALSNPPVLTKLAHASPQEFLNYIKNQRPGHSQFILTTDMKKRLIDAIPKDFKQEMFAYLATKEDEKGVTWDSDPPVERSFAEHAWAKELPGVIQRLNPHGFSLESYRKLLPLMQTVVKLEGNLDDNAAELSTYKLATFFKSPQKTEEYLNKFANRETNLPIHDALLFELPKEGHYDLESWQQFAMRNGMGPRALKLVGAAPKIEMAFAGRPSSEWSNKEKSRFRALSMEQLYDIARNVSYDRAKENPALASLCIELGVEEKTFNKTLKIYNKPPPEKTTPDIHIDGNELGFPGFHFDRVKAEHPWNAFIGKMVNCCNYIGGFTEKMAIAQIQHPDCSLYVLTNKEGEPIAKCTGWMSEKGNLVFNAWERLSASYDKMCEPFLLAAAKQAMGQNENIQRVTLGTNKANAGFALVSDNEKPTSPENASADASLQYEVAVRERLKLVDTKLEELKKKHSRAPLTELPPAWQQRSASLESRSGSLSM
jgi:hypothetical protein